MKINISRQKNIRNLYHPATNMTKNYFDIWDYIVFGLTLLLSTAVGLYHSQLNPRKQQSTTEEFLMGGRQLPVIPVSLSLMTTFVSGFSLLGVPAEVYQRGLLMWIYQLMGIGALLLSLYVFIPIFYRLKPISIYEYFERRFGSRLLRQFAAALFFLNNFFYMGVVMYAPAVALSGVTDVPTWPFILSVGAVCTLYTTLGGLRGVVWTDTLQAVFMYAGVFALIIKGTMDNGGVMEIWQVAKAYGRVEPLGNVDPNPVQYFSIWISIFGGLSFWMSLYGLNQMSVQRFCSLPTLADAKKVVYITIPAYFILISLCSYIGLAMLASFRDCDPLSNGDIQTKDQLVILWVLRTLGSYSGLPGLFLSSLFSGTLSTVSGGINSMAAVLWEDFLKHHESMVGVSQARATLINKGLVFGFGMISMVIAFLAGPMGGIIQTGISIQGSLAGPLVGLFFLGVFVPRATKHGTIIGMALSMVIIMTISVGSVIYKPYAKYLLFFNDSQCSSNITFQFSQNSSIPGYQSPMDYRYGDPNTFALFRLSSYSFPFWGLVLLLVLAIPACWLYRRFGLSEQQRLQADYLGVHLTIFHNDKATLPDISRARKCQQQSTKF